MTRNARSRKNREAPPPSGGLDPEAIRESAQRIWLAGLGAFERARAEGPRVFETLVEQGRTLGARAMGAADETLKEMRQANFAGARIEKLEQVFEERVSRSLERLGVLTRREVEALSRQVEELQEAVRKLSAAGAGTPRKAAATRKTRTGTARAAKGGARKRASRRA